MHLRILATSALSWFLAVLGFSSLSSCASVVVILEESRGLRVSDERAAS